MCKYRKSVQETFNYTNTVANQWKAVEIKGFITVSKETSNISMPEFNFPKGYERIETPFSGNDECCHLCGTRIKNLYYIQNDETKNTMVVGSECVTHFENSSGEELKKESLKKINREEFNSIIKEARELLEVAREKNSTVFLKYCDYIYYTLIPKKDSDRTITLFMNKNKAILERQINKLRSELN